MQGSTLYAKYPKVNIGALINFMNEIDFVNTWLKENLFYKVDYDAKSSKLLPVCADYNIEAHIPSTFKGVCRKLKVDSDTFYEKAERIGDKVEIVQKSIEDSFCLDKLFKSNSAGNIDYSLKRYSLVEKNLIHHPKYEDIKDSIEEIKSQVCAYASRIRGKGKMYAEMTVLYSSPGCEKQALHKDDYGSSTDIDNVMSCIIALEEGTGLDLAANLSAQTRDTFKIPPGSFFLFCGSQVHGGTSYTSSNLRLHFYLHENRNQLDRVNDGNIGVVYRCKVPDCNYSTTEEEYLLKHETRMHADWKQRKHEEKYAKKAVKKSSDGRYYCHAEPDPCENISYADNKGLKRHYKKKHLEWWDDYKRKTKHEDDDSEKE